MENKSPSTRVLRYWALLQLADVAKDTICPAESPADTFKLFSIPVFDEIGTFSTQNGSEIGSNKFVVTGNDILVSKLNPWFSRVIYTEVDIDAVCSTEFVVWKTSGSCDKSFLFMVASSAHFRNFCIQNATGTSNSHKRVNPEVMMSYRIPYEQELVMNFGKLILPILLVRQFNQNQNQQLTDLRDWLLPMLMNGQIIIG